MSIWSFQHYMPVYSPKDIKRKFCPNSDQWVFVSVLGSRKYHDFWHWEQGVGTALYVLHCTALQYITLPWTALVCTRLHCTPLHCTTALHHSEMCCISLPWTSLHYTALHFTNLSCSTVHCPVLNYTCKMSQTSQRFFSVKC